MPLILPGNVASATASTGYNIDNSCRFDLAGSASMSATQAAEGNRDSWTFSAWVKRGNITTGATQQISCSYQANVNNSLIAFNTDDSLQWDERNNDDSTLVGEKTTNAKFRDPSAWYHIVYIWDSGNATSADRMQIWVNGVRITSFASSTDPGSDQDAGRGKNAGTVTIGRWPTATGAECFDGYMAEVVFLDGAVASPVDTLGQFNKDSPSIWEPIDPSGLTFGDEGYYLDFETDGTNTAFADTSSNARAVTAVGSVTHSFAQSKFNDSSIYFDGSGDALTMADGSHWDFGAGNFTVEFWCYKAHTTKEAVIESRSTGGNGFNLEFGSTHKLEWYDGSISGTLPVDPNAITANTWTHYALVRNGTTFTMYRDGSSVGTPLTDDSSSHSSAGGLEIGRRLAASGGNDFTGYLDDIRVSSTARYTSNFAAPTAAFTSDGDTVALIQSKASNLIGADVSGQGNHFTEENLAAADQATDTPTNNFATLNPLLKSVANPTVLSEGNCKSVLVGSSNADWAGGSTIGLSAGKWYWEIKVPTLDTALIGITDNPAEVVRSSVQELTYDVAIGYGYTAKASGPGSGYKRINEAGTQVDSAYGDTYDNTDIIGVALNIDDLELKFYKDNVVQNSGTAIDIIASTNSGFYFPAATKIGTATSTFEFNFGGCPAFALASAESDENGYGNFEYAPPSGFLAICTKNLGSDGG